jgi:hypothetical protein
MESSDREGATVTDSQCPDGNAVDHIPQEKEISDIGKLVRIRPIDIKNQERRKRENHSHYGDLAQIDPTHRQWQRCRKIRAGEILTQHFLFQLAVGKANVAVVVTLGVRPQRHTLQTIEF